jgi:hypothetical protein
MQVLVERFCGCADKTVERQATTGDKLFHSLRRPGWTLTARRMSAARPQSICQKQKGDVAMKIITTLAAVLTGSICIGAKRGPSARAGGARPFPRPMDLPAAF